MSWINLEQDIQELFPVPDLEQHYFYRWTMRLAKKRDRYVRKEKALKVKRQRTHMTREQRRESQRLAYARDKALGKVKNPASPAQREHRRELQRRAYALASA